MMIKTSDGEKSVASAGVGGTGLGLGIGALSLALLRGNGCGGGILGNLFGNGWGNGCGCNSGYGLAQVGGFHDDRVISSLQAELANERSERYADMVGINTFKEAKAMSDKNDEQIRANYVELAKAVAQLDKDQAVNRVNSDWQYRVTNERIDCAFNNLKCYVDGTFVPGVLKMPAESVCPLPMSRYNSWTAPTTTQTATATESATANQAAALAKIAAGSK